MADPELLPPAPGTPIVVGMSGGVDSSVAALLLKEAGWDPIGVTLWLRDVPEPPGAADARAVAERIGIRHETVDARELFREKVVDAFVREHWRLRTPNPCVFCNRDIKWDALLEWGASRGAEHVATGHYARVAPIAGTDLLARAGDPSKDQSYFLWRIDPARLRRARFPLRGVGKDATRAVAARAGLPVAEKKDSQDICFLPDGAREELLRRRGAELGLSLEPGPIFAPDGKRVGTHAGLPLYTRGQRQGLGVAVGERVWAKEIDPAGNAIRLSGREGLFGKSFLADGALWHADLSHPDFRGKRPTAQLRYRSAEIPCEIEELGEGRLRVELDEPAWAITPGQSAVFRVDGFVVGGAYVAEPL